MKRRNELIAIASHLDGCFAAGMGTELIRWLYDFAENACGHDINLFVNEILKVIHAD